MTTSEELSLEDYLSLVVFSYMPSDQVAVICNQLKSANFHQFVDLLDLPLVNYPLLMPLRELHYVVSDEINRRSINGVIRELQRYLSYELLSSLKELLPEIRNNTSQNDDQHVSYDNMTKKMLKEDAEKYRKLVGPNQISDALDRYDLSNLDEMIDQEIPDEDDYDNLYGDYTFEQCLYDLIQEEKFTSVDELLSYLQNSKENLTSNTLKNFLINHQQKEVKKYLRRCIKLKLYHCTILARNLCQLVQPKKEESNGLHTIDLSSNLSSITVTDVSALSGLHTHTLTYGNLSNLHTLDLSCTGAE